MTKIQIIIGTVMGTALEVGQTLEAIFEGFGYEVLLNPNFKAGDLGDNENDIIVVCTSNTGMGDLPDNIAPLYSHLLNDKPNMTDRQYAIVNLGDSSYPNFAEAGRTLDEAFADVGAKRVGEPCIMDAILVSDYEEEAANWATEWVKLL